MGVQAWHGTMQGGGRQGTAKCTSLSSTSALLECKCNADYCSRRREERLGGRECGASTNFKSYSHAAEGGRALLPLAMPRSYVNCRVIKIIIIMLNVIKFLI